MNTVAARSVDLAATPTLDSGTEIKKSVHIIIIIIF